MSKFNLIKNTNEFDEAYFDKDIEKMNKLYYKMSCEFEYLLEELNEKDLIDVKEFKDYLATEYSHYNFDSDFRIIEEYQKNWASELPHEKIEY